MNRSLGVVVAVLALALASCNEEKTEQTNESKQTTQSTESAPASTTTEPDTKTARQSTEQDTETLTNDACVEEAKKQTGESDITVTSNEYSEANTLVMLGVGANRATWRCLVSNAGEVAEMSFVGDDSTGAPKPDAGENDTSGNADATPNYERPVGGVLPDGSSFTASGQIKCVRDRDAADAMCDFGVVREGNGNGWVMVFWPDSGNRVIFYENLTPVRYDRSEADGDAEMTVNKDGDMFVVFVGDERFEIIDAIMTGG